MRYLLRKTVVLAATLLIISFLAFLAFQIIPGDPTTKILGAEATPERVAALRHSLGLDQPFLARYWDWLSGFVQGDFGLSYAYFQPVRQVIDGKVWVTASLSLFSFGLVILLSLPTGVLLARFENSWLDRLATVLNQLCMSIPPFFIGIIFTYVFGLLFRLFTPGQYISLDQDPAAFMRYLFFPALAIALPKSAMCVKLLRGGILDEMEQDYIRTAFSRGRGRSGALLLHALRNALLPVLTFLAVTLADIVAGSIIIEQVFSLPGLGRLLLLSISNRDFPVVQAVVVLLAAFVVLLNFLTDVAYQYIDPRIRIDR